MKKRGSLNAALFLIVLDSVFAAISLAFKQYNSALIFVSILICYSIVYILITLSSIEVFLDIITDILFIKTLSESEDSLKEISKMSDEIEKELQEVQVKTDKNKSKQEELDSELVSKMSSENTKKKPGRPRKTNK